MKKEMLYSATAALFAGALLLPVTMPRGAWAAESPFAVPITTMEIDGLTTAYREAGDPSNPTALPLHGSPNSSRMFRDLMPELADDFHLIAPDNPGFGASDMPPPTATTTGPSRCLAIC